MAIRQKFSGGFLIGASTLITGFALSASAAFAAESATRSQTLRRGDFVRVTLHSGAAYHLQLNMLDDVWIVGRSGTTSVHLQRAEVVRVEPETPPPSQTYVLPASTAALGLLGLSAAGQGASQNFGAGHCIRMNQEDAC